MYTIYLDSQTSMNTTNKETALSWIKRGYKYSYTPLNVDYDYWRFLEIA